MDSNKTQPLAAASWYYVELGQNSVGGNNRSTDKNILKFVDTRDLTGSFWSYANYQ